MLNIPLKVVRVFRMKKYPLAYRKKSLTSYLMETKFSLHGWIKRQRLILEKNHMLLHILPVEKRRERRTGKYNKLIVLILIKNFIKRIHQWFFSWFYRHQWHDFFCSAVQKVQENFIEIILSMMKLKSWCTLT